MDALSKQGGYQLAQKLSAAWGPPETPLELANAELSLLGRSLHQAGTEGVRDAQARLQTVGGDMTTNPNAWWASKITALSLNAFGMFKVMETVVRAKGGRLSSEWSDWQIGEVV